MVGIPIALFCLHPDQDQPGGKPQLYGRMSRIKKKVTNDAC